LSGQFAKQFQLDRNLEDQFVLTSSWFNFDKIQRKRRCKNLQTHKQVNVPSS